MVNRTEHRESERVEEEPTPMTESLRSGSNGDQPRLAADDQEEGYDDGCF